MKIHTRGRGLQRECGFPRGSRSTILISTNSQRSITVAVVNDIVTSSQPSGRQISTL